ncbi:condensin complex subunit 2 [[Candida] railenensis]|uniref:Condensin complex subunit 2 n=1 Tax=[Candida] railenensis TaxID=45579 RepID=A0A9P0VXR7_9ASCO|nr:condensin complex subunit 2 [[Candida] railenensis]
MMVLGDIPTNNTSIINGTSTDFDLWLRMATDNKINAKNSWNFALIDYFQDLTLLRDGEGINFQRASVTLDGCVKIYSSRVDSAATETGKLLSGLSAHQQSQVEKVNAVQEGDADREVDDEDYDSDDPEYGKTKKKNKKVSFSKNVQSESTSLMSFKSLRAKKVDYELAVDPVFRRALADFDEGGAKSLLLNMLNVDSEGRVMFDSERQSAPGEAKMSTDLHTEANKSVDIDIYALGRQYIPDDLSKYSVCPSMAEVQHLSKNLIKSTLLDNLRTNYEDHDDDIIDNDKNDLYANGSIFYDDNEDMDEYPEISLNIPMQRLFNDSYIAAESESHDPVEMATEVLDYDLMAYFDNHMQQFWQPKKQKHVSEHWKVTRLKSKNQYRVHTTHKHDNKIVVDEEGHNIIDFINGTNEIDEDELFAESSTTTFLPKHKWSSQRSSSDASARHTLPNDIQFVSKRLISLFIKPEATLQTFNKKRKVFPFRKEGSTLSSLTERADEEFWSEKYREDVRLNEILKEDLHELHQSYDQSFFQDEEFDDGNCSPDLHEDVNPMGDNIDNIGGYGSQLVTARNLFKPTYINFSKVAKRVDVKLLKENLWECLNNEKASIQGDKYENESSVEEATKEDCLVSVDHTIQQNFSETIGLLNSKYTSDQLSNLSTSFCFICVLHLANEHGLELINNSDFTDLCIQRTTST